MSKPPDPAPEYTEWIAHRYDPGYYLGGRIHPLVRRLQTASGDERKNPYGYLLMIFAVASIVMLFTIFPDERGAWSSIVLLTVGAAVLQFVAGWKLVTPRSKKKPPAR